MDITSIKIDILEDFCKGSIMMHPDFIEPFVMNFHRRVNAFHSLSSVHQFKLAVEAKNNKDYTPKVVNRTAVIPVMGPLVKRESWLTDWFGYTAYEKISKQFKLAMSSSDVDKIIFHVNSPGGTVSGIFDLFDLIFGGKKGKSLETVVDSYAYSAAYNIASASDKIHITNTSGVGSVGVIAMHMDMSKMLEDIGIKVTEITAGEKKADFSPFKPLSKTAKEDVQKDVDKFYDMFAERVASGRSMKVSDVKKTEAGTFYGQEAVDVGFADSIYKEFDVSGGDSEPKFYFSTTSSKIKLDEEKGGEEMSDKEFTYEEFKAKYPNYVKQAQDEAVTEARNEFAQRESDLLAENEDLTKDLAAANDRIAEMEKDNIARICQDSKKDAGRIWEVALSGSDVPEKFHEKVRKHVKYEEHLQEDGTLNEESFTAAVKAEIEDWEKMGVTKQSVDGLGTSVRTEEGQTTSEGEDQENEAALSELKQHQNM